MCLIAYLTNYKNSYTVYKIRRKSMQNKFCKYPLWEVSKTLSAVAMGIQKAETVIVNARLINVCTREIIEGASIAISKGRIAFVGEADHTIGENTKVIDAMGSFVAPGFLDGHIHVESSMLTVSEYARAVVPHGTVGIYMDPHEICNVLGLGGVSCMMKEAENTPLKTMLTTPSCVPAVEGFEDTGSFIGPNEVAETMTWENCVGLGEMMNFPGVQYGNDHVHGIIGETLKADKIVTGHYSMPETGAGLNSYIASGVRCCHESTRKEDALAKMRLGMYVLIREGSAWRDLVEVIKSVTENNIDSRFACLISDDTHPHTLLENGHIDHIVRRAIAEGVDPIVAIQMVTINCAQCFRMDHELGSIAPGKCADIIFFDSLEKIDINRVIIDGEVVSENGKMVVEIPHYEYPDWTKKTMQIKNEINKESFKISAEGESALVRVIEIIPLKVGSFERQIEMKIVDGEIFADSKNDILKAVVFERHHKTGTAGKGFVTGFGITNGAMASTVAHDAHNLLVVGTNDEDMALAAETLIKCGGGMAVTQNGKVLGCVELPIAGLMNPDKNLVEMSETVAKIQKAWEEIGCDIESPFMTMALIPLACLPELRLTNRGLVDCVKFQMTNLLVEKD